MKLLMEAEIQTAEYLNEIGFIDEMNTLSRVTYVASERRRQASAAPHQTCAPL
jgi:hypothetical protein